MAPDPRCAALAAAKANKGWSYSQIASSAGQTEQRVIDICTGESTPTQTEFDAIARALGIQSAAPATSAHVTK